MSTISKDKARFDARLSIHQKQLLEKAALLGGYRSLTDFVLLTAQEKANEIIKEKEKILTSERDSQIFFDAIFETIKPSSELKSALKDYETFVSNTKR